MAEQSVPQRIFASTNEKVGALGYGAMGLAAFYGNAASQETVDEILSECLHRGVTMIGMAQHCNSEQA